MHYYAPNLQTAINNISNLQQANNNQVPLQEQKELSLFEAKMFLNWKADHKKSAICPCCERVIAPPLKRHLSKALAYFLMALTELAIQNKRAMHYDDVREFVKTNYDLSTNDYSTLVHYGLIETPKGSKPGHYLPTRKGYDFLLGKIQVPRYYDEVGGKLIEWSTEQVSFSDVIDTKDIIHVVKANGTII